MLEMAQNLISHYLITTVARDCFILIPSLHQQEAPAVVLTRTRPVFPKHVGLVLTVCYSKNVFAASSCWKSLPFLSILVSVEQYLNADLNTGYRHIKNSPVAGAKDQQLRQRIKE